MKKHFPLVCADATATSVAHLQNRKSETRTSGSQENRKVQFCNEGAGTSGSQQSAVFSISFENELSVDNEGWAQIAPFGDFLGVANVPQPDGTWKKELAIQRMDKQAVADMVNEYEQSRKGLLKLFKGRPLYLGHPDEQKSCGHETEMSNCGACVTQSRKYPDKSPKGIFAKLAVREDGFYGEPILTDEGAQIVASGKARFLSGRWSTELTGETVERGGKTLKVFRPSKFYSAGLTNTPRLPVQMLNESDADLAEFTEGNKGNEVTADKNKTQIMKKKLIAALALAGITFANEAEATDEKLESGIEQLGQKAKSAVTFENEITTLKTTVQTKDTEIGRITTERDNLKTSFANERTARAGREIALALTTGRITAAEKADWERRLGKDTEFSNELEALNKLAPKVKTESITITRGDRKVELANSGQRAEMVNELMDEVAAERKWDRKRDHSKIFNEVQRRHPALFEGMKQPTKS
jgi:hypothetical protein